MSSSYNIILPITNMPYNVHTNFSKLTHHSSRIEKAKINILKMIPSRVMSTAQPETSYYNLMFTVKLGAFFLKKKVNSSFFLPAVTALNKTTADIRNATNSLDPGRRRLPPCPIG